LKAVESKEEIRREIKLKRCSLQKDLKERLDSVLREKLRSVAELQGAESILFFFPVRGEPDIVPLLEECLSEGRKVYLPSVNGEEIIPRSIESLSSLRKGNFGIPEPESGSEGNPEDIDVILVPGLAFDRECYRLGWGKGFYDRLLKRAGGFSLGIAYSFQVLKRLPRDHWDIPVDAVVTEKELIRR